MAAPATTVRHAARPRGLSTDVLCAVVDRDALPDPPKQAVRCRSLFWLGPNPESASRPGDPAGIWNECSATRTGGERLLSVFPAALTGSIFAGCGQPGESISPAARAAWGGRQCAGCPGFPGAIAGGGDGGASAGTSRSGRKGSGGHRGRSQNRQCDRASRSGLGAYGAEGIRSGQRGTVTRPRTRPQRHVDSLLSGAGKVPRRAVGAKNDRG